MKKRKLALQERAARASDRVARRGHMCDHAHEGYLVGYRAAQREAREKLRKLQERIVQLQNVCNVHAERARRFEEALRNHARRDIYETRPHPYKELTP